MNDFEYKVSVIVPVYNVEDYVGKCLESLINQTIDLSQLQVIIVNDGSTDNSLQICEEYAELYDIFEVYTKENEGLSATRNYALQFAKGKYLMYLDSDDTFTPETVKNVTDFFDKHYDEVDSVTFPIIRYKNGKKLTPHHRYTWLKRSGVYDLKDYPYILQTTINIATKNKFSENILFDTTPHFRHEDQKYNNDLIRTTLKIGFCAQAEYQYYQRGNSIMATYKNPIELFETTMDYYEKMFSKYEQVPKYLQSMFFHDINWKLQDNCLWPYHYEKEQFDEAINRFIKLLNCVETDVILHHPSSDSFLQHYWLSLKTNSSIVVYASDNGVSIVEDGKILNTKKTFEIICHKIRVKHGKCRVLGFLKTFAYNYLKDPADIYVIENGNTDTPKKLSVFRSVHSYYKSRSMNCKFWAFDYTFDVKQVSNFTFKVLLDGYWINTSYWFMPVASINDKINRNSIIREYTKISFKNNMFFLTQVSQDEKYQHFEEETQQYKQQKEIYFIRTKACQLKKQEPIWLYYDLYTVKKDNAYYQFINDFKHSEDNIKRYYIYNCDIDTIKDQFTPEQQKYLVQFGSTKHKILYVAASKVLTAFFGFSPISPFKKENVEMFYSDLIEFETIYLQHGVLHASLRMDNAVERCRAEKIVVSSQFEIDNYMKNYHYQRSDLVATGMSRYDHIDKNQKPKNRILFAPSWRFYLTYSPEFSVWQVENSKFVSSDYYQNIFEFISSERLHQLLEDHDLYLDFKLHPIISSSAQNIFQISSDRIQILKDTANVTDYQIFMTDFSSYVFDYAYLNRPIIYFVPDMEQFKAGMNHYRELDLPFEKAFGNLVLAPEDATDEIERIILRNFVPDPIFSDRMNDFYLPLENCSEKLYQYLIKESSNYDSEYHHSNL